MEPGDGARLAALATVFAAALLPVVAIGHVFGQAFGWLALGCVLWAERRALGHLRRRTGPPN